MPLVASGCRYDVQVRAPSSPPTSFLIFLQLTFLAGFPCKHLLTCWSLQEGLWSFFASSNYHLGDSVVPDFRCGARVRRKRVAVDRERNVLVGMPKSLCDDCGGNALAEQDARVRVPQRVKSHGLQTNIAHQLDDARPEAIRRVILAVGLAKNEIVASVVRAEHRAVKLLLDSVLP